MHYLLDTFTSVDLDSRDTNSNLTGKSYHSCCTLGFCFDIPCENIFPLPLIEKLIPQFTKRTGSF